MPRGDTDDLTNGGLPTPSGYQAEGEVPVFVLPPPTDPMMMSEPEDIMNPEYTYVTDNKGLREAIAKLRTADRVGFDIETASTYVSYAVQHGSIRLIQLGMQYPDGKREEFVIDQWDVDSSPLFKKIFENTKIRKVIHNSMYEQRWYSFMHDVDIANQFCTMRALGPIIQARREFAASHEPGVLGPPQHEGKTRLQILREYGYSEVIAEDFRRDPENFGLPFVSKYHQCSMANAGRYWLDTDVDKAEQGSLWSRRPLTDSQKKYAAVDARILLALEDLIIHEANFWEIQEDVAYKGSGLKHDLDKKINEKRWRTNYERTSESIGESQSEKEALDYDASYRVNGLLGRARTVAELDMFHAKSRQVSLYHEEREHAEKFYRRRRKQLKAAEARGKKQPKRPGRVPVSKKRAMKKGA